jgi:transposase-like protein
MNGKNGKNGNGKKGPGGRPTKYTPDMVERAYTLLRGSGLPMEQLAVALGVHRDTLYEWMELYPEFSDAVKKGRDEFDTVEVEKSLFYKATVTKDTVAQIFWLKNRNPRRWRDKQDLEHSGNIKIEVIDAV